MRKVRKLAFLLFIVAILWVAQRKGLLQVLSFEGLRAHFDALAAYRVAHPALSFGAYFSLYVFVTSLSLPGAAVLTLGAGALFGLARGTLLVSFASSLGATLAMLAARFLFRESVEARLAERLRAFNAGIGREGLFYLFTLRLIPAVPFFLINLAAGLTRLPASGFYLVSQIGMLPGTLVYVNAGTQLARLSSPRGLLSAPLLGAFALLALTPFLMRSLLSAYKRRRLYAPFRKPRRFDYNLITIGAGSAGLVTSYIGAAVKARCLLIERERMGGDCLNTGCVPSKALLRSAKILSYAGRASDFGFRSAQVDFDFAEVMQRVQRVIKKIEPHDSVERYTRLGVDCVTGEARLRSPWEVEVGGTVYTARNIVIASGAAPFVPRLPGLTELPHYTSESIWSLRKRPERLLVLGGGPVGCELAQAFARLGSQVTILQRAPQILEREDSDCAQIVQKRLESEGLRVLTGHEARSFQRKGSACVAIASHAGADIEIACDAVLIALGRKARVQGFGLEEMGVRLTADGRIETDEQLRATYPNLYACGDVAGPYQFTHVAAHQAWYCAVNALFSPLRSFKADMRVIPWCTYTDPECARVGLNEKEALDQNIPFEVTRYDLADLDRAITDAEAEGMVKVLSPPGSDRILGATIVGPHAGELLAEFVLAMKHGVGLDRILGTIHAYPTLSEAGKFAAGNWKRAHAPAAVLRWLGSFHAWRRG